MLRCRRCGSVKFIFTTPGDMWGEHHGAICALCRKPLCVQDADNTQHRLQASQPAENGSALHHHGSESPPR